MYVYTRGIIRCLLGFWPLGQNPAREFIEAVWRLEEKIENLSSPAYDVHKQ